MYLPLFFDIANYMKEIIAKYSRRGDVVMQCHRHCCTNCFLALFFLLSECFFILFFVTTR